MSASGHTFGDSPLALADIKLDNADTATSLNPSLKVGTPAKWPNGATVTLRLVVTFGGVASAPADFTVAFQGQRPTFTIALSSDSASMRQHEPARLGVSGFTSPDSAVSPSTPGLTYKWTVSAMTGHSFGGGDRAASASLTLGDAGALDPTLGIDPGRSGLWPPNSTVTLGLVVETPDGAASQPAAFTVTFIDTWSTTVALAVGGAPSGRTTDMDQHAPGALGTTSVAISGSTAPATGRMAFRWTVASASGYTGFAGEAEAMGDIGLAGADPLNPTLTVGTPMRWRQNSSVVLRLEASFGGIANETYARTVRFTGIGWSSGVQVVLSQTGKAMNQFAPADLGVVGLTVGGRALAGATYRWEVVSVSGHDQSFPGGETGARGSIGFSPNATALNPTLTGGHRACGRGTGKGHQKSWRVAADFRVKYFFAKGGADGVRWAFCGQPLP